MVSEDSQDFGRAAMYLAAKKASAINNAYDPTGSPEPFLLIFRTSHVVTAIPISSGKDHL